MLFSRLLESARSDSKENNATLSRCRCLISLLGAGFAVIPTSEKRVAKLLASQTLSARRKEQDSRAETIARQNVLRLYLHISVRYYSFKSSDHHLVRVYLHDSKRTNSLRFTAGARVRLLIELTRPRLRSYCLSVQC